jgi:D-alanine-D-alanine ligase
VIEEAIPGRRSNAVRHRHPEASPVGEVRYTRDFYDYEAKYLDPSTEVIAPTDLPEGLSERVRDLSLRAFRSIDGSGLSRVDFFLRGDGSLIIDEINTMPGFTPASITLAYGRRQE